MAKGAATEAALAALHSQIAKVLEAQLSETIDINAGEEDREPELMYTASPALLTLAARFVKDNGVTFDVGDVTETSAVKAKLKAIKENRGKVVTLSDITPIAQDG